MAMRRIAVSTGGGDAPGLNAVIRAIVLSALNRGWECVGIRDGYNGLLAPADYPSGGLVTLDRSAVRGITHLGGTILGTTNRGNPLRYPVAGPDGRVAEKDRSGELVDLLRREGLDALISIGGDGSLAIAHVLSQKGLPVVGVPKTIDNDLDQTVVTFGFDTAVHFATECIDRLHSTAESHRRVLVVEVMGRYAGWIALHSGVAASADVILIPEIPYDIRRVAEKIAERERKGRFFSIVVVAEGAAPVGGGTHPDAGPVGRDGRTAGRGGPEGERGDRGADGQGVAGRGAGAPAARRRADLARPAHLAALRRRGRAGARRGPQRRHGGARPARGEVRAARGRHPAHEDRAPGRGHRPDCAGPRDQLRGLKMSCELGGAVTSSGERL